MTRKAKKNENTTEDIDNTNQGEQQKIITQQEERITKLTKQVEESELTTKRAQSDYIRLKIDMDSLIQRTQEQQATSKIDTLIEVTKKILPLVNSLDTTVSSLPEEIVSQQRGKSIIMVHEKMLQILQQLNIKKIQVTKGEEPDLTLHIPIGTQPVEDQGLQGKIIQQVEAGYIFEGSGKHQPILPAKVIVGE